jgi:hypothetical protein
MQVRAAIQTLARKMSVILLASGISLGVTLAPVPVMAQDIPPQTITTQGHGEVRVKPDSLSVQVTVESKAPTLAAARDENNRKMQSVIAALKGLNIQRMKLETQNFQVYPIHGEYQKDKLPKVIGYQATNSLNVSVTGAAPESLGDAGTRIVDTALNAGANNVGGLNFYLHDMSTARTQALQLAVQDARKNAEAMAKAADTTLNGLYSLEGSPQFGGFPPRPMAMYSMKAGGADAEMARTPVETGETTVTSDVTARFKF